MANSVNGFELDQVVTLVNDFRVKYLPEMKGKDKELVNEIAALDLKRDSLAYDMVAALVDLAIQLDVENEDGVFVDFLIKKKLSQARAGQNPYMPFIKAVFAEKVGGKWEFPKDQRGKEKHANHVRFLVNAKRKGLITGTIQDYIRSYPDKLKGIEAQDRADNPNAGQGQRVDAARERGRKAPALFSINDTLEQEDGTVLQLWGVVRDGQFAVLEAGVANDNDANSLFYRLGKSKS